MSDTSQNEIIEQHVVTKHEFYFETPLYCVIKITDIEKDFMDGDVDGYNPIGFDTTYKIVSNGLGYNYSYYDEFYLITLICKRKGNSVLKFFVFIDKGIVVKLGQYPSLADLQFAELGKKYRGVLDSNSLFEFKRAIGLAAHSTGVGSFVYLRRIFEGLISPAFHNNKTALGIDESTFLLKRMEERVQLLAPYLPSQLVNMKSIYSILSKGLHELSEKECLAYFKPLKLSIELILDQKIEIDLKRKKDQKVKNAIQDIHKQLGK